MLFDFNKKTNSSEWKIIDDGVSGFLVDPKDHDAFAEKIVMIIQNDTLNQSIGLAAREKVAADFDIDILVKRNIEFYCSVLKGKK